MKIINTFNNLKGELLTNLQVLPTYSKKKVTQQR